MNMIFPKVILPAWKGLFLRIKMLSVQRQWLLCGIVNTQVELYTISSPDNSEPVYMLPEGIQKLPVS